ncbi:MAG: hypothetical protein LBB72_06460 [Spirochaetaceae bacterium]|jgi:hypothetical protein|nr:hypothetical protein [Spirochaetaceae bacterium]
MKKTNIRESLKTSVFRDLPLKNARFTAQRARNCKGTSKNNRFLEVPIITLLIALAVVFAACSTGNSNGGTPSPATGPFTVEIDDSVAQGNASGSYIRAFVLGSPVTGPLPVNTEVTIQINAAAGMTIDWVKVNDIPLTPTGGAYKFRITANSVITAHFSAGGFAQIAGGMVYYGKDGGFAITGYEMKDDHTWSDANGTYTIQGESKLGADGTGMDGGKAIELAITEVKDYYAFEITGSSPFMNLNSADALSLWIKTDYEFNFDGFDRPVAVDRVMFGEFDHDQTVSDWIKAIKYAGEFNEYSPDVQPLIELGNEWQRIIVPIPDGANIQCDTIRLYFKRPQIETVPIFIDKIEFVTAGSKTLESVILPESGSIPGGNVATDLELFTQDTKLIYKMEGSTYTLYGKNPVPGSNEYLNRFTDFYTPVYSAAGAVTAGGKISVSGYNTNLSLTAAYNGVTSSAMAVKVMGQTPKPTSTVVLEDHTNADLAQNAWGGEVKLPLYWGGTAGDAQIYQMLDLGDDKRYLYCFIRNITVPGFFGDDGKPTDQLGYPLDDWYVTGNLGLNHDLSELTEIVIRARLSPDIVWTFSLSSGYPGVAETLNANGEKFSHSVPFTGKNYVNFTEYVIPLSVFRENGVDLTRITGYEFFTDMSLNSSQQAKNAWEGISVDGITGQFIVDSVTVR